MALAFTHPGRACVKQPTQEGAVKNEQIAELLYQALETETGGIQVYETALTCVINADLKKEWEEYLEQTQNHHAVLETLFGELGFDPSAETPGRAVVRNVGESLVTAMETLPETMSVLRRETAKDSA